MPDAPVKWLHGPRALMLAAPLSVLIAGAIYAHAEEHPLFSSSRETVLLHACVPAVVLLAGLLPAAAWEQRPWRALLAGALAASILDSAFALLIWGKGERISIEAGAFTFLVGGYGILLSCRGRCPRILLLSVVGFTFWLLVKMGMRALWLAYESSIGTMSIASVKPTGWDLWWTFLIWLPAFPFIAAWALLSRPAADHP